MLLQTKVKYHNVQSFIYHKWYHIIINDIKKFNLKYISLTSKYLFVVHFVSLGIYGDVDVSWPRYCFHLLVSLIEVRNTYMFIIHSILIWYVHYSDFEFYDLKAAFQTSPLYGIIFTFRVQYRCANSILMKPQFIEKALLKVLMNWIWSHLCDVSVFGSLKWKPA